MESVGVFGAARVNPDSISSFFTCKFDDSGNRKMLPCFGGVGVLPFLVLVDGAELLDFRRSALSLKLLWDRVVFMASL